MSKYSKEELFRMYSQMMLGRVYQEIILERIAGGHMGTGFFHLSIGTESLAIGILDAMKESDYITPNHRQHALFLDMLDFNKFTAELMGRYTGYCHGKSFEFHLGAPKEHMLPNGAILGSAFPYSVGAAFALKLDKKDGVVITCVGDGTSSEGNIHEAMNIASVLKAPVVFVFDNNKWAISQPSTGQFAIENLADRAAAYGMKGFICDGHDVEEVRSTMEEAIELARKGEPCVVEMKTIRHRGHFEGDMQLYRDDLNTIEEDNKCDCIGRVEKKLLELGYTQADFDEVRANCRKRTEDAFAYAEAQPWPTVEQVLDPHDVYADVPGGENA